MFCTVYLLRRQGAKVPPDEVRRYPNPGWLYFGQNEKRHLETDAILYRDETKQVEILRLGHAHLRRIDGGGMMLGGNDSHIQNKWQRQAWWIVPSAP